MILDQKLSTQRKQNSPFTKKFGPFIESFFIFLIKVETGNCNLCDRVKNGHVTYWSHFSQKSLMWTNTLWCLSVAASLNYLSHFSQKISHSWTDTLWCLSLPASLNHLSQTVQPIWSYILASHKLIHTGKKLFKCMFCKKEFFRSSHSTRHN